MSRIRRRPLLYFLVFAKCRNNKIKSEDRKQRFRTLKGAAKIDLKLLYKIKNTFENISQKYSFTRFNLK
jgi:hypothetical protein